MQTQNTAYVSWTETIVAMSLLLVGSYPVLGQAPASNAAGNRECSACGRCGNRFAPLARRR